MNLPSPWRRRGNHGKRRRGGLASRWVAAATMAAAAGVYELHDAADKLQANYPKTGHSFPAEAREVAYKFLDRHLGR